MIIKEQFTPPAMRYADANPPTVSNWAVMIAIASATTNAGR